MRDGPEREEPIELHCFKECKVGDIHLFMMTSNRIPDETLYSHCVISISQTSLAKNDNSSVYLFRSKILSLYCAQIMQPYLRLINAKSPAVHFHTKETIYLP